MNAMAMVVWPCRPSCESGDAALGCRLKTSCRARVASLSNCFLQELARAGVFPVFPLAVPIPITPSLNKPACRDGEYILSLQLCMHAHEIILFGELL